MSNAALRSGLQLERALVALGALRPGDPAAVVPPVAATAESATDPPVMCSTMSKFAPLP